MITRQAASKPAFFTSRIGLGLAALGRPGYINLGHADDLPHDYQVAAMAAHCHAVLDAAWTLGVRYVDAARSYGRAEEFLASWLAARQFEPGALQIGSKWGYTYTADWKIAARHHEIKDHAIAVLLRQAAESRQLLGSHLGLYQIHSATLESGVLTDRAVVEELARMRAQGLRIGITTSGPRQAETLRKAMDVRVGGEHLFDCVQVTWNLLEPSLEPALQEVHAAGVEVIVKEGLANGRLTARNDDPGFTQQRSLLGEEAARLETTVDGLALAAILAKPWASVVLSGAATADQLRSNVAALKVPWDRQAAERLGALAETPEAYWQTRGRLAWN